MKKYELVLKDWKYAISMSLIWMGVYSLFMSMIGIGSVWMSLMFIFGLVLRFYWVDYYEVTEEEYIIATLNGW